MMNGIDLSKEEKKSVESFCRRVYGVKFNDLKYSAEASAYSDGIPVFLAEVPVKQLLMTRKKYRNIIFSFVGAFVIAIPTRKTGRKKHVFVIFINNDMGWGKKNIEFTFWHEVGHIANRDIPRRKRDKRSDLQKEIDADRFATEKTNYTFRMSKWGMSRGERDFGRTYLIAQYPDLVDDKYALEFLLNRMMKKRRFDVYADMDERIRRQNALVDEHNRNLLLAKAG